MTRVMKIIAAALVLYSLCTTQSFAQSQVEDTQGSFFAKKTYLPEPLPQFPEIKGKLPSPIDDEHPDWVTLYWKAWEIAFRNFHQPQPNSHFVSNFIDAAFNQNIFLWDTCFMSMFCNSAHPLVPGIASLDNFYARQHSDGEICREINRATGADYTPWTNREGRSLFSRNGWDPPHDAESAVEYRDRAEPSPAPFLTLDALDNPLPAWAELESFSVTGDRERLGRVYQPLAHYYAALRKYLRQGNGLYITDWASMDNSPRNSWLARGGTAVDTSCQMVLFAKNLAKIAHIVGDETAVQQYSEDANALSATINRLMWDAKRKCYFDLNLNGQRGSVRTVAAYWALLAQVASSEQAAGLVAALHDPHAFGTALQMPTLAVDEMGFDAAGGYWRGAVWAPTTMMVIRGLENYHYDREAADIARNNIATMSRILISTGTIWENYAPIGQHPGEPARKDFVGWSGLGPIGWLLEYGIGLKPDAPANKLLWRIDSARRVGCERYRFNGHVISLLATPAQGQSNHYQVHVISDGAFSLSVEGSQQRRTVEIHSGEQDVEF